MDTSGHTIVEFNNNACVNIIYRAILVNRAKLKHTTEDQIEIPLETLDELLVFDFIDGAIHGYTMTKSNIVINWAK